MQAKILLLIVVALTNYVTEESISINRQYSVVRILRNMSKNVETNGKKGVEKLSEGSLLIDCIVQLVAQCSLLPHASYLGIACFSTSHDLCWNAKMASALTPYIASYAQS